MNDLTKDLEDAKAIGAGYDRPAIEIHPPQTVIERRNGRMEEVERAAFVMISTAFKGELKDIDEIALKVWLFIALSVNRYTKTANPGLRAIHDGTGFAVNTIRDAIERLENKYHLLKYTRGTGKMANIYEPLAYVSVGRSVSGDDTQKKSSVSVDESSVSVLEPSVSASRQENAQLENYTNYNKRGDIIDGMLELYNTPGAKKVVIKEYIASCIKIKLGLNPSGKDAEEFIEYSAARKIKDNQDIDVFIDWWRTNFRERAYWSFSKMKQQWPAAFMPEFSSSNKIDTPPATRIYSGMGNDE